MLKIASIIGTRPEIIRLSIIIKKLDQLLGDNHILIDTGQNYDKNLRDIFFAELGIRKPNYFMEARGSFGKQIGTIIEKSETLFKEIKPDKVLILGDTNSGLSAYVAERLQIPVYHCEAGNRSYDKELPEEINRKLIDHVSSFNLPYTSRSRENLLREGISPQSIFVSGNPIFEVINHYFGKDTDILDKLNLIEKDYIVVTLHRSNNVDDSRRLTNILRGLAKIGDRGRNIIISTHPRTRDKVNNLIEKFNHTIKFLEPMGFSDFITLQKNAQCILTDCLDPNTYLTKSNGELIKIKNINIQDNLIGQPYEKVLFKNKKEINTIYEIKTIYNKIIVSENHELFKWQNNKMIKTKAKELKIGEKLVSYCKIKTKPQTKALIAVENIKYVKIKDKGITILKNKSQGDKLSQFGKFKCNNLYLKKGIAYNKLIKILKYLKIDYNLFKKYIFHSKINERTKHILLPTKPSPNLSELIGFACGDGFLIPSNRLSLFDQNEEVLKYFQKNIKTLFKIESSIKKDKRNKLRFLLINSKVLTNFLIKNFKTEFEPFLYKDISLSIQKSNNKNVSGYLRGLFEAEGCVYHHSIGISMASKEIIQKTKLLLLRFGIISNYYEYHPRRKKDKSTMYILHIYESKSKQLFKDKINFISKRKKDKLNKILKKANKRNYSKIRHDNFFEDKIVSITVIKSQKPFVDLKVSPTNTFFANGILSHNSGTVQEESCILRVPCVVIRKHTERLETIECGASILSGVETDDIYSSYLYTHHMETNWTIPKEYLYTDVSKRIINYLIGR